MMEQFPAEDRPSDIFHPSPAVPTVSYAEQQCLEVGCHVPAQTCHSISAVLQGFFALSII